MMSYWGPSKDAVSKIPSGLNIVAHNASNWQWEYDASEKTAFVTEYKGNLRLFVIGVHTKSGIGAGTKVKELLDVNLGTIDKPKIGSVAKMIAPFGHQRSRAGGPFKKLWGNPKTKQEDTLANIISQYKVNESKFVNSGPYLIEADDWKKLQKLIQTKVEKYLKAEGLREGHNYDISYDYSGRGMFGRVSVFAVTLPDRPDSVIGKKLRGWGLSSDNMGRESIYYSLVTFPKS